MFLFESIRSFCQNPHVYVFQPYIQINYVCLTNEGTYDIEIPVFKVTDLANDQTYDFSSAESTVFDGVSYEPSPYSFQPYGSYWKWIYDDISIDTVLLHFYGDYENLDFNASEWLYFGLYEVPPPGNGDLKSANVSIITDMEIYGSSVVCSSPVTFDLLYMPTSYTSATWKITQDYNTMASGTGTTASANNLSDGSAKVTFTVHFTCGLKDLSLTKDFWVGLPNSPYIISFMDEELCKYYNLNFCTENPGNPANTYYDWRIGGWLNANISGGQGTTCASVYSYESGYMMLSVAAQNECGSSDYYYSDQYYIDDCMGGRFIVSPNPASDYIKIELLEDPAEVFILEVYNPQFIKVISTSLTSKEKTIDISKLSKGVYFVTVSNKVKGKGNRKVSTGKFVKE